MTSRFFITLAATVVLLIFVFAAQASLSRICEDLAAEADRVEAILSEESTQGEGLERLNALSEEFDRRRPFLGIFVNDARIHEIQRAFSRAKQLGEEGDVSPALEALTDLSKTLKELSETHRPSWENIL